MTEKMDKKYQIVCGDDRWLHREEIYNKVKELAVLLEEHDQRSWAIGDLCNDLLTRNRVSLSFLARQVGSSKSRLSEFTTTAAQFPAEQRKGCFQDCLMAKQIYRRMPALNLSLLEIRDRIIRLEGKKPRQIRYHFIRLLLERERSQSRATIEHYAQENSPLLNVCHHADCRDIIPMLPDGCVKLFIADPPFGGYYGNEGGYLSGRASTSGLRVDCDFNSDSDALDVTVDLFEACRSKIAEGGALVLFQPGGKPDRVEVLQAAQDHGWECKHALVWYKEKVAPTDRIGPYSTSSERILVFGRPGDQLKWHDPSLSRADVLTLPSITSHASARMEAGALPIYDMHMFQKPSELAQFLIKKHTHLGELVVEPFGCSGWASLEAARLRRQWVYIESHPENFAWGSRRIHESSR